MTFCPARPAPVVLRRHLRACLSALTRLPERHPDRSRIQAHLDEIARTNALDLRSADAHLVYVHARQGLLRWFRR